MNRPKNVHCTVYTTHRQWDNSNVELDWNYKLNSWHGRMYPDEQINEIVRNSDKNGFPFSFFSVVIFEKRISYTPETNKY